MTYEMIFSFPCSVKSQNKKDHSSGLLLFKLGQKNLYVLGTCTPNLGNKTVKGTQDDRKDKNVFVEIFFQYEQKITVMQASLKLTWECSSFAKKLNAIFQPKRDWTLTYDDDSSKNNGSNNLEDMKSISSFVLYKVHDNEVMKIDVEKLMHHSQPLSLSDDLRTGSKVITRSYPFGPDILEVFTDAVSCGVISNISTNNELILTDARCLPGSEGGGLYLKDILTSHYRHSECLVGMIISPLCWKSNELVGFTICCSMRSIFLSLQNVLKESHDLKELKAFVKLCSKGIQSNLVVKRRGQQPVSPTVVKVDVGGIWGSGVVVAARSDAQDCDVMIVSCRHVVEKALGNRYISINVTFDGINQSYEAKLIFVTDEDSAFDLAILTVAASSSLLANVYLNKVKRTDLEKKCLFIVPYADCKDDYVKGKSVYVKGYPLFDTSSMSNSSVSAGVISNAVCCNNSPVVLHSTCLVHKGGSGGGLICMQTGKFQGVVVNHVKEEAENISYPDVNFSIPAYIFMPCVLNYLAKDHDKSVFKILNCGEQEVIRIWNMEPYSSDSMQIMSKL